MEGFLISLITFLFLLIFSVLLVKFRLMVDNRRKELELDELFDKFSELFRRAPPSFKILRNYARSKRIKLVVSFHPRYLEFDGRRYQVWFRQEKAIFAPAFLLNPVDDTNWSLNLLSFAHEIGHVEDNKRGCFRKIIGKWSLCPAREIRAERQGRTILKKLKIMPRDAIVALAQQAFSERLKDILKENKECSMALLQGKCPQLTWEELMRVIDYGVQ